jgi:hypothetical protein
MEDIHIIVDEIANKKKEINNCNAEIKKNKIEFNTQLNIKGKYSRLNSKKKSYNRIKDDHAELIEKGDKDEEDYIEELSGNMTDYENAIDGIIRELKTMGWTPEWEFNNDIRNKLVMLDQDKINLQAELEELETKEKHVAYSIRDGISSETGNPPSAETLEDELEEIFNKIIRGTRVLDDGIIGFKDWETGMRKYFEQIKALKLN